MRTYFFRLFPDKTLANYINIAIPQFIDTKSSPKFQILGPGKHDCNTWMEHGHPPAGSSRRRRWSARGSTDRGSMRVHVLSTSLPTSIPRMHIHFHIHIHVHIHFLLHIHMRPCRWRWR